MGAVAVQIAEFWRKNAVVCGPVLCPRASDGHKNQGCFLNSRSVHTQGEFLGVEVLRQRASSVSLTTV